MSAWLEALLGKIYNSGVSIPLSKGLNFTDGLKAVRNPSTQVIDVTFDGDSVVGATGATGPAGEDGADGATGATGPAGSAVSNEHEITISTPTTWSDFDLAAAAPGIAPGDIVALVLEADLVIDSIEPPTDGFWCWIGIRDTGGDPHTVRFVDRLNGSGGTSAWRFRTPGTRAGDTNAVDYVLSGEEDWTSIGYTNISDNWRIFESQRLDVLWVEAPLREGATAAQNAAILQNLIDGGIKHIQMPAGSFTINSINLASSVHLRGRGIDRTTLTWGNQTITTDPSSQGPINVHGTSPSHIKYVVLEDFTIDGNKSGVTISGSGNALDVECISFIFADFCHCIRVKAQNAEADGFDFDDSSDCTTTECIAENCDGYGFHSSERSTRLRHTRDVAITCGAVHSRGGFDTHGTNPNQATGVTIEGCVALSCYRGFVINGLRSMVIGCHAVSCVNTGIRVSGTDCTISACVASSTTGVGGGGNGFTFESSISGLRNTVTGCKSISNATDGFNFGASTTTVVIGNSANGNSGTAYTNSGTVLPTTLSTLNQ